MNLLTCQRHVRRHVIEKRVYKKNINPSVMKGNYLKLELRKTGIT